MKNKPLVDRRSFLRRTAAAGAGAAALGVPAQAQSTSQIRWDLAADVVIAGAGASGLPAAIMARDLGASVIVIDSHYDIGGHAMLSGGTIVMPEPSLSEALRENAVTHVSGTPSFWRLLLAQIDEKEKKYFSSLKQITLGGETVPQELLDRLAAFFPQANITHIYASTEMGACFEIGRAHV